MTRPLVPRRYGQPMTFLRWKEIPAGDGGTTLVARIIEPDPHTSTGFAVNEYRLIEPERSDGLYDPT